MNEKEIMENGHMLLKNLAKKNEQTKFNLLKHITEQQIISIQDLMITMNMDRSAVYYSIKQLIDDLDYFQIPVQINYHSQKYTTQFTKENMTALAVQSQLLDYYMQISPAFQLLTMFLKSKHIHLVDAAECLQLSIPHIYKIVRTASEFLTSFNLFLLIEHKMIRIIGTEPALVAFRFFLQTFLTSDIHSFFQTQEKILPYFPKSYHLDALSVSNKQALCALVHIMEESNLDVPTLQKHLHENAAFDLMQWLDRDQLPKEEAWKAFLIRVFFPQVIEENEMILCGKIIQEEAEFPAAQLAAELLDAAVAELDRRDLSKNSDSYCVSLYRLTLHLLYIQFFKQDVKQVFYHQILPESVPDYESTLYQDLDTFFENFQSTAVCWSQKQACKQGVLETLYLLIHSPEKPQVKVYLDFLGNTIAETALKQKIALLFGNEIFHFTTNKKEAEVLITNHIARIPSGTIKTFHIQNLADKFSWERMFTELFQLAYQKSQHTSSLY